MGEKYWRGRPVDDRGLGWRWPAFVPKALLVLAGALVGFAAGSLADVDLAERPGGLGGGPMPVSIAKQYTREVLEPTIEAEIAGTVGFLKTAADMGDVRYSLDTDWEYGEPACTGSGPDGECHAYDVPATVTMAECFGHTGSVSAAHITIHVEMQAKTANHTAGRVEERDMVC